MSEGSHDWRLNAVMTTPGWTAHKCDRCGLERETSVKTRERFYYLLGERVDRGLSCDEAMGLWP